MKFKVCNRKAAETSNGLNVPHIIISITTPGDDEAILATNEMTLGVLRLSFHDLDREPGVAFKEVFGEPILFNEEDAEKIVQFVHRLSLAQMIVVHCDAGQSRSAGVAAALAKALNGDDDEFFFGHSTYSERRFTPNRWVYRILLNRMMQEGY